MKSKLSTEYKQKFDELRTVINSWELLPHSPSNEFDSLGHLLLSQLYKGYAEFKISKAIQFELTNNYGITGDHFDSNKMTREVLEWWNNAKK